MDIGRLPRNLVLLYESRDIQRRGPRPALNLDTVIMAGIAIADAEGLAAVSMSRVAERVGFTTMSLYRYVRSKEELLLLMADRATNAVIPVPKPRAWRAGLGHWTKEMFATYRRHPWLLQVTMSAPPAGPAQLRWMEAGIQNLSRVPIHEGHKLQIIQLLHGYARGEAQMSTDLGSLDPDADVTANYGDILRTVTDPASHPALSELVASGVFDGPTDYDEDIDFGFGLTTILTGVAHLIAGQAHPHPAT